MLDVDHLIALLISLRVADPTIGEIEEAARQTQGIALADWSEEHYWELGTAMSQATKEGLLEVWEGNLEYETRFCLSIEAVARYRLRYNRTDLPNSRPYWTREYLPEPPPEPLDEFYREVELLDIHVDLNQPEPHAVLVSQETLGQTLEAVRDCTSYDPSSRRMRMLLGLRPIWPVYLGQTEGRRTSKCPACGGKKLGLAAYCVVCDRSGVDRFLDKPKVQRNRKAYQPDKALAGGTGAA